MFTQSGRQQRAYERYVRKSSLGRVAQQKRFKPRTARIPVMMPSEPVESAGPVSVSSGEGGE